MELETEAHLTRMKIWKPIKDAVYTFIVFVGFILLLPIFLLQYIGIAICRYLWFLFLSRKATGIELVKNTSARTAMDTHRNQGIITVLLQVKGQCDLELVKRRITEDVIEKRRRDGSLRFPHMRMALVSFWGRYAWVTNASSFNVDNHVKHDINPIFRNRVVTSSNIQEYVSDAITKYIPPWNKNPPWEIRMITTEPDRFYILARLHHLYISEDGITFGDFLMIKPDDPWSAAVTKKDADSIEQILAMIYQKPTALPVLYDHACQLLSNAWNELVSLYDPYENPYILKGSPTVFQFSVTAFITFVSVIREYAKGEEFFKVILKKECSKRHITSQFFFQCLSHTLYPPILILLIFRFWYFLIKNFLHFPALFMHILYDIPVYLRLCLLIARSLKELVYLFKFLYKSPRVLLEELIFPLFTKPKHRLQKISLSGRKVVSWTNSIPLEKIKSVRDKTGVASCEIQLYGVAAALHEYFQKEQFQEPDCILTTTRFIPEEDILKSSNRISSGLLCLPLPMKIPSDDPLYGLHQVQLAVQEALSTQTALYIASLWQYDYGILTMVFPSVIARIMLYVLSKRYPIMMSHIEAHNKELQRRNLVWGQEVEAFFYWRPPQANVSISMSLISYGDELRFAVMADAELSPEYNTILTEYVSRINQLVEESENYTPSRAHSPAPQVTEL